MSESKTSINAKKFYFNDTSFSNLMMKRIYHVLLISSAYDAFFMEEDGRIDEQIFNEYVSLNLRYPPQFIMASSEKEAIEKLSGGDIDLVITMLSAEEQDTFVLAEKIKKKHTDIPIVVLTPFSREVSIKVNQEELSTIDYIFSWLGDAELLLAVIKLIEDKMNVEHDVKTIGVQTIILVENSIRFYSSYLPNIYKIIFKQSKAFMTEGLNDHKKMMRMRGRPKILLATNYEEAIELYEKYKNNLLGIISDISYNREGVKDNKAGIRLCEKIKSDNKFMPILLQSSDVKNEKLAKELKVGFLNKNSKTLSHELRSFIRKYFSFGDFVFTYSDNSKEVARAGDLKALQEKIFQVPDKSLIYHLERNHFSKWLRARALFPLAELFMDVTLDDFDNIDDIKRFIFDAIASFRLNKARGVIADFKRDSFDEYSIFTRIGDGSLGGKARGLAFLDTLIKRNRLYDKYNNAIITIPRTLVLCTDVFDEFMEDNKLYKIALTEKNDEVILKKFIKARLPIRIHEDLFKFISVVNNPIAIRSSSLLEDSYYQPFAGIYNTYMIPNDSSNENVMSEMLCIAIKSVYASAFYKDSKAYMTATSNIIDEEKMGIVLQEVTGKQYGEKFYPVLSGVARSINFYPIDPEKPENGIANIALGLGKYIVDGGTTLRFSPKYPKKILQTSTPDMALRETQKQFYALDLCAGHFVPSVDDSYNLLKLKISDAEKDNSLKHVASTFDFNNNIIRDGANYDGKKLITFSNILKYDTFPLANILMDILKIGQEEMGKHVEIEFAVEMDSDSETQNVFNILQIRPIVANNQTIDEDLSKIPEKNLIMSSESALGNGIIDDIVDFVYVKPESFDTAKSSKIAEIVGKINEQFIEEQKNYILVGPGRWGSSDPWLGIPVRWAQISAARVIVESGLANYRIDPSQGTHFFQNLTSFRVGYFTINPFMKDGFYDLDYLAKFDAVYEDDLVRHIRFKNPIIVKIDGQKNKGVIYKAD